MKPHRVPDFRSILFSLLICCHAAAQGQVQFDPVPPVQPTRSEHCDEQDRQWNERLKQVEAARFACERRDGGTVQPAGVWLPNCGSRQQAYVTCASFSDQLCAVRRQQEATRRACHAALSAYRNTERVRSESMQRQASLAGSTAAAGMAVLERYREMKSTYVELSEKGIAATVIDKYTTTPDKASDRVNEYLREAARTANTRNPDGTPAIVRIGKISEGIYERAPFNPIAKETGRQSDAAARARMGDALDELDQAFTEADANFELPMRQVSNHSGVDAAYTLPTPSDVGSRPAQASRPTAAKERGAGVAAYQNPDSRNSEGEQQSRNRNIQMMRCAIQQAEHLQRRLRSQDPPPSQGLRSHQAATKSPAPCVDPSCRDPEVSEYCQ